MIILRKQHVIGTWRVVITEVPQPSDMGQEFFHFSPDGEHYWEYPFIEQRRKVWKFRYLVKERGIHIIPIDLDAHSDGWDLPVVVEGDDLVITNTRGHRSWLSRIHPSERPPFLTMFFVSPFF